MALPPIVRQTWVLTKKNLTLIVLRHWFWTFIRALAFPIVLAVILGQARNWISPTAGYGIGQSFALSTLGEALDQTGNSRPNVVIVDNGLTGTDVDQVITNLTSVFSQHGKTVTRSSNDTAMAKICAASLQGISQCWSGLNFTSSPASSPGSLWAYTILRDSALGGTPNVNTNTNDAQLYAMPLQVAVDSAIAATNTTAPTLHNNFQQYGFTYQNQTEAEQEQTESYQDILFEFLLCVFYIALCGITFHLPGFMAGEREAGMTQLIDAMIPSTTKISAQVARFMSLHIAFDIVYLPGWIVVGALLGYYAFPDTNIGVSILFSILTGLALSSASLFMGAFFQRSQLSGNTTVIIGVVLALAAQYGATPYTSPTASVLVLGFFFPPATYVFLGQINAYYQQDNLPINFNKPTVIQQYEWLWSVSASTLIGFLVLQIVLYPIAGALIERLLYGISTRGRIIRRNEDVSFAVRIQNLFVEYKKKSEKCCGGRNKDKTVKAVNDVSLDWTAGSITCLLGVNGSGKSTILNSISGLKAVKSGTIEVDGSGGFGICPQKNVMWRDLTVMEHVNIFSQLKSSERVTQAAVKDLVARCDLDVKLTAFSKTLSGGQKRKLQLAMMFAGGSKVCAIDEASSGIDPLARRKIWDILLAERKHRSILLTTHYLEEADVLADHIAIMSKGSLKVEGSAVELKSKLGGGYHVVFEGRLPESIVIDNSDSPPMYDAGHTIYTASNATAVSGILRNLELNGIRDYRIHEPTTENVFMKVAEEMNEDETEEISEKTNKKDATFNDGSISTFTSKHAPLELSVGTGTSFSEQLWILFSKRWIIARSNYMPYVAALFIPLCAAGLITLFFKHPSPQLKYGIQCSDQNAPSYTQSISLSPYDFTKQDTVFGPPNQINFQVFNKSVEVSRYDSGGINASRIRYVSDFQNFTQYVQDHHQSLYLGAIFNDGSRPYVAWQANIGYYSLQATSQLQNMANLLITQTPTRASWGTFATSNVPDDTSSIIQAAIYMALALCVYPALFAMYPAVERKRGVRALHYSNGIRSGPLWISYFLYDFIFVLLISIFIVVIWSVKWAGWYALGYVWVVLVLYGMTSIAFSYCVSLFVGTPSAAFAASAGIQILFMILYFVAYITSQVYAPPAELQHWLNYEYFTICLITPSGNMLRTLLLTVNSFFLLCRGDQKVSYPGQIDVYGGPILYLILQFFVLTAFLTYWDAGWRPSLFFWRRRKPSADAEEKVQGKALDEGAEDPSRLKPSNEGVQIQHLTKRFGSLVAVDDVSLGLNRSDTLALLGPNGAGKSTLISLLRGDIRPSDGRGSITIEGHSVLTQRTLARSHLGVCSQFDAMDNMTVRQQLRFYARARGVVRHEVEHNIAEVMRAFKLTQYQHRLAAKLSGGNQRKLSLACALVGGPTVLLLDEPSSGLDPVAQRTLWRELKHISQGRVVVLSTHSMEEADALCQRAAIMAGRILALGPTEDLREKYGALHVHLVHSDAPHASQGSIEMLKEWISTNVPDATIEEREYYGGQVRFSVPAQSGELSVAELFTRMEAGRKEASIAYYSIGRTTLDDVFLSVVRKHKVQEENYEK